MRFKTFLLLAALPISLSACGQSGEGDVATDLNNAATDELGSGNDDLSMAPSSVQELANKAAASDRFEIETSRLAAESASSSAVRDFASMMITAHTESTAKLKSTLASDAPVIAPDDALNAEQQATLADLKSKKGADFDKAYAVAQVSAHEKTLAALKDYGATGDKASLKAFAQELIPTVTEHLDKARALK